MSERGDAHRVAGDIAIGCGRYAVADDADGGGVDAAPGVERDAIGGIGRYRCRCTIVALPVQQRRCRTDHRIEMTDSMFSWLVRALRENFAEVRRDHDAAVARLQKERERLRERMK